MDNRKKILIGAAVFLAIGALSLVIITSLSKKTAPVNPDDGTSSSSAGTFPVIRGEKPSMSADKFDIKTQKDNVPVDNVYKLPDTKSLSEDGVNFKNSDYYYMAYYPKQQGFIIAITNPDIETARKIAEQDFLDVLKISKDQACELNVSLTVTPDASQTASGGNYGLSFCPNGKPFPQQ